MTNGDFVNGMFSDETLKQIVRKNGIIHKLTIKSYSSLSKTNIRYYLNFRRAIRHRQFFKKNTQSPEYVETFCNFLNNAFHLACRRWHLDNQSQ